jgi:phosphatidylglycerol:prolipoprotein diacylglycerol transferase
MHPVLFHVPTPWGSQPVFSYGLMLSLSILAGWLLTVRFAVKRDGMPEDSVSTACLVTALGGLLGGRLLYVAVNPMLMEEGGTRWYELTSGGSMAYGGFFGGLLVAAIYTRIKGLSLAALADDAAPGLTLGTALTRVGCYLYGCDFGTVLPEGAPGWLKSLGTFPRWSGDDKLYGSPALFHHQDRFVVAQGATASAPVHPTQLYDALFALVLFGLSLWLLQRRAFRGQVIATVGGVYAIGRFLLEYVRDEPDKGDFAGFTIAQLGSIMLFALCALAFSSLRHRENPAT